MLIRSLLLKPHKQKTKLNFVFNNFTLYFIDLVVLDIYNTDEQYVVYLIEIPYQKLGLYWYWLIFQNSAIPITNQYQQKYQIEKTFKATQCFILNIT
jgi:hypothetical protein